MMRKILLFLTMALLLTQYGFSKPKDNFKFDAQAEFKLDDSDITGDKYYVEYELEGEIEMEYRFTDRLSATLAIELDRKDVDAEEISASYWIDEFQSLRAGLFDSSLVMNDFVKKKKELFFYDSPGVKYVKDSGFSNIDTGVEYKNRHFLGDNIQLDASAFFNSAHNESQFILTGYYNFLEGLDFIAFSVSYLPFVVHNVALGASSEYKYNNFIFDLKYYKNVERIVWSCEANIGTNLIDPVGYLHFPGEDDSWFASADVAFGYNIPFQQFTYTPALRCGILCPDLKYVDENRRLELMLGNWFHGKYVFVHLDGGVRFDTYKSGSLKTKVEPIWGINVCIKS